MSLLQNWIECTSKDHHAHAENADPLNRGAGQQRHTVADPSAASHANHASHAPSDYAPGIPARLRPAYFASTGLDLRHTHEPEQYPQDICIDDVCYRKVDPMYYAWLRKQMFTAKQRFQAGKLPNSVWQTLRCRFNFLQEWAIQEYGLETLKKAIHAISQQPPANPCRPASQPDIADNADVALPYSPPVNPQSATFLFPAYSNLPFSTMVSHQAIRQVDAIRDEALALGWTDERLYQNRGHLRFPYGQDYGLVCFIHPGELLGRITNEFIEILHHSPGRIDALRFANADAIPPRVDPKTCRSNTPMAPAQSPKPVARTTASPGKTHRHGNKPSPGKSRRHRQNDRRGKKKSAPELTLFG